MLLLQAISVDDLATTYLFSSVEFLKNNVDMEFLLFIFYICFLLFQWLTIALFPIFEMSKECLQIEQLTVFVLIPISNHDLNSSNSNQLSLNNVKRLEVADLLCNIY